MGDGPDGLLVSQSRQQPAKHHFEYASFDLDRRLRSLIQQAPHGAVTLGRARALRLPCALLVPRTHPHPRGQRLLRSECRCLGSHFGDHLQCRVRPETRDRLAALVEDPRAVEDTSTVALAALALEPEDTNNPFEVKV